jgi:hypothetical protein
MKKMNQIHNRREFLKSSATAAAGLSCIGLGLKAQPLAPGFPPEDLPNTHNMMIVGEKTVFLSHLPMFVIKGRPATFNSPHRFQVILEATFSDGTKDLTAAYASDRLNHPTVKMYTLNPADFVLSRVNPSGAALKKFRGNTVFRGHLERDGEPFIGFTGAKPPPGGLFDVNIKRVIHFHQFALKAAKPTRLEYLLFGKGAELFLAHFITKPGDFDQIISVKIAGQSFTDEQLAKGMHVIFSNRGNTAVERLKENDNLSGQFQLAGGTPQTLSVAAVREFYFEEGELAVPPNFDPTAEEKKSGFE